MMNKSIDPAIENLIQDSYAALKSGDQEKARELAQKAADLSPDCEKAWLILASLSKEDQSLFYLEKALRANPESQAAREGVRVIFAQMAADKKTDPEEPAVKLEDTAPIPVHAAPESLPDTESAPQPTEKAKAQRENWKTAIKGKMHKKAVSESDADLSVETPPSEKGKNLRRKLFKAPKDEVETAPAQKTRINVRIEKKAKKELSSQEKARANDQAAEIPQKTSEQAVPEPIDQPAPTVEIPAPALPDEKAPAIITKESTQAAEQQPVRAAVSRKSKEEPKESVSRSPARVKPKKKSRPVKKKIKQSGKKARAWTNSDVDIVELILISAAAILLPLMALLYFLLK